MKLSKPVQSAIKDIKTSDLKTNGNGEVVWRPGLKSIILLITLLGFGAKGVMFYAQTVDTTKTVKRLVNDVDSLKIEAYVNEKTTTKYVQEILRLLEPEKAENKIAKIEKERDEETKELKKIARVNNGKK